MKKVLLLLLCTCFLTGCSDNLSQSLMIISLGVDVSESGYTLSIKAPNYGATGKSSDQQGGRFFAGQIHVQAFACHVAGCGKAREKKQHTRDEHQRPGEDARAHFHDELQLQHKAPFARQQRRGQQTGIEKE